MLGRPAFGGITGVQIPYALQESWNLSIFKINACISAFFCVKSGTHSGLKYFKYQFVFLIYRSFFKFFNNTYIFLTIFIFSSQI